MVKVGNGDDVKPDNGNGVTDNSASGTNTIAGFPVANFTSGTNDGNASDGDASGGSFGEPVAKRRGRKPGSKNKSTTAKPNPKNSFNLGGIEALLFSIHAMGAAAFHAPEIALTDDETKTLTSAIAGVAVYYPTHIDEKTIAWTNLAIVAVGLYGTRAVAIYDRIKTEKAPRPPQTQPHMPPNNVSHINPNTGGLPDFIIPGRVM